MKDEDPGAQEADSVPVQWEDLCLHGAQILLGLPLAPSGISQLSVLKSQSLVLWVSFAGDLCVPPGSDLSDFVL